MRRLLFGNVYKINSKNKKTRSNTFMNKFDTCPQTLKNVQTLGKLTPSIPIADYNT